MVSHIPYSGLFSRGVSFRLFSRIEQNRQNKFRQYKSPHAKVLTNDRICQNNNRQNISYTLFNKNRIFLHSQRKPRYTVYSIHLCILFNFDNSKITYHNICFVTCNKVLAIWIMI